MTVAQEGYGFFERGDGTLSGSPLGGDRLVSFLTKAVLRSTSFTRCSVEGDDKLPTPVFEKSGSGL